MFGLGVLGAGFGRMGAVGGSGADPLAPGAPTVAWETTPTMDTTPNIVIGFVTGQGPLDTAEDDVLKVYANGVLWFSHTVTAGDIAGTPATLTGIDALAAGSYTLTARIERGVHVSALSDGAAGEITTSTGLLTNLIGFWSLEEASGDALDETANNLDLTDNNTVTSATGKVGNGRDFEAGNTEFFNRASEANLQTGDIDFSFSLWVNMESKPNPSGIVFLNKGASASSAVEYQVLYHFGDDRFKFEVYNGATTQRGTVAANNLGSPSLSTWYHIVCWHDATNNQVGIVVNNGTANTAATSGAMGTNTQQFTMGRNWDNSGYMDGVMDQVGFWKNRVLSSGDIALLYNSGNGLSYAAMA